MRSASLHSVSIVVLSFALAVAGGRSVLAAPADPPRTSQILDRWAQEAAAKILAVAEARPQDHYDFAPTTGEFAAYGPSPSK
jgi:hypothetical protein